MVLSYGHHASCLRGIDDIESACRSARALKNEYLFERVQVPSETWSRWDFLSKTGFVKARSYAGTTRGGRAVLRTRQLGVHETVYPYVNRIRVRNMAAGLGRGGGRSHRIRGRTRCWDLFRAVIGTPPCLLLSRIRRYVKRSASAAYCKVTRYATEGGQSGNC